MVLENICRDGIRIELSATHTTSVNRVSSAAENSHGLDYYVESLRAAGVSLDVTPAGRLRVSAPSGALSAEDRATLAERRDELVALLSGADPDIGQDAGQDGDQDIERGTGQADGETCPDCGRTMVRTVSGRYWHCTRCAQVRRRLVYRPAAGAPEHFFNAERLDGSEPLRMPAWRAA